ncbi:MAG: hypothetical protein WAP55_01360 [Minisyncoccia bacterium]
MFVTTMRGKVYGVDTRRKAEKLRSKGKSYKDITDKLDIPKSTLSGWLGEKYPGVFDRKAQLLHLARIRTLAKTVKIAERKKREKILRDKITPEISRYPLRDPGFWKSLLVMLYWAEGAKYKGVSGLKFVNTDPNLALFYISLLRRCYKINNDKFRIRLHLHHYHNTSSSKKFWSNLLEVPQNQFGKIYFKKRSKTRRFRKNFMGICFISYLDSDIRKELLEIARQLKDKIT